MTTTSTLNQEDEARAGFYALLARLFVAGPDMDLLAALAGAGGMTAEGADKSLPEAWDALRRAAAMCDAGAVHDEYDAVFIGVGRAEAMLYASFYLAGFLMEKPLASLRDDLSRLGLARQADVSEPEDHLSALCEVMRHLILRGESQESQKAFFAAHIEPWHEQFAEAALAAPSIDFYRHAVRFAAAFLAAESQSFALETA